MVARTIVIDSGGTARQLRRWLVVDSGGTTRQLKRVFVIDSGGTARQVFNGFGNVSISNATGYAGAFPAVSGTASYQLEATGEIYTNGPTYVGQWIDTPSTPSAFDCRATLVSGTPSTGTFGSWLSLGSQRLWTLTSFSNATVVFTLEIRLGVTVVDTATITMQVEYFP